MNEVDGSTFELLITPGSEDAGIYEVSLFLTDGSGEKTFFSKHVYVEKNYFPDLSVSASQTVHNNLAEYTLDGNFDTYWESDEMGSWLIYDLGDEFLIDSLRMAFTGGETHKYSFSAFSSLDAIDWKIELYAESSGNGTDFESFGFQEPKNLRYVKIIGYGSDIEELNSYTEVRFSMKEQSSGIKNPGFDDLQLEYSISHNHLDIQSSLENQIFRVDVYNLLGSRVYTLDSREPLSQVSLPLSTLDRGIYLACVFLESGVSKRIKFLR
jgi:hypothetical protein